MFINWKVINNQDEPSREIDCIRKLISFFLKRWMQVAKAERSTRFKMLETGICLQATLCLEFPTPSFLRNGIEKSKPAALMYHQDCLLSACDHIFNLFV